MKKRSFKLIALVPVIIMIMTGCWNGVSKDAIKNALYNEENCLKLCDEKEAAAIAEYIDCIKTSSKDCVIPVACSHVSPENQPACIADAINKCQESCLTKLQERLEEINNCRRDCRDKFPLELKIK